MIAFASSSCGPQKESNPVELSIKEVAVEIIEAAGNCTLISLDSAGHPRARIMNPFPPSKNFELWFGTNDLSRKVREIKQDNRVTVIYYDKHSAAYASIYGTALIVEDSSSKTNYWKPEWSDFYPDYPEGYVLIKVIPERIEVISEKHGITGNPQTWEPEAITF